MATNGNAPQSLATVLSALDTLQSNVDRSQKAQAHEYLERFQKSPEAWTETTTLLQSQDAPGSTKLFAATTLKGKIIHDLYQLPRNTLPSLRDTLLSLLSSSAAGARPTRTQLCVCLANLAIQMTEWKDVVPSILAALGNNQSSIPSMLEFLHVLPEEVTEGRKINLSEDELQARTTELLQDNGENVIRLLIQYAQSSPEASQNPLLLECITSWFKEVPMNDIVNSPLLQVIFNALNSDSSFDAAVECLSAIFKETREVDEYLSTIQTLYPHVIALRSKIDPAVESEDADVMKGITRIMAEAGEAWVVLIARLPTQFRSLVEVILECATKDKNRDGISLTFFFWYDFKQYLTLERYIQSRLEYADIYATLVDVMIRHLEYPKPESNDERDLFDGDREQEEKFREFRHQMGDVLKSCCEVMGVTECLRKPFDLIQAWFNANAAQIQQGQVPNWQAVEAPLFAMRAMGKMVSPEENIMLPKLMPIILQIPNQEKVRFQAVMALGRYSEWTANHPDTLQPQLDYIMASFQSTSKEITGAAALAFKFFCNDCADLLKDYIVQLQQFYASVLNQLPRDAKEELTDGVASVVSRQPLDNMYQTFKLYCDPIVEHLKTLATAASTNDEKLEVADQLQLITLFIQWIQPFVESGKPNPAVQYCQEIFPVLAQIADHFVSFPPVLESICRCWRYMVLSYRSAIAPLLPSLADKLAAGFSASRQGCFLWATDSIVREFSNGAENVDDATTSAIYNFFEAQSLTFFRALSDLKAEELPDVIEDYFRLASDVVLYFPHKAVLSTQMKTILSAASESLTLLKEEPLLATLRFLRDFLAYGGMDAPSSGLDVEEDLQNRRNPPEVQTAVKTLISQGGEALTKRVLTGMMYSFPRDCFPDASGVMLALFQILPEQSAAWVKSTITMLPPGSLSPQESERFVAGLEQRVNSGEIRKVRMLLQDFTNQYRRRHVAPREGLGRLEGARFHFAG